MTVSVSTIQEYIGSNVLVSVRNEEGEVEQLEGKIEVASAAGVGFKPRRKRELDLLEVEDILAVWAAPETATVIKQAKLKPVDVSRVKKHLVDRHGAPLSQVNALTPEQAQELHNQIDHSDLGHNHEGVEKAKSEADEVETDEAA